MRGGEPSASLNKKKKFKKKLQRARAGKQMLALQWRFEERITDQKIKSV